MSSGPGSWRRPGSEGSALATLISEAVDTGELVDVPANALAAIFLALGDGLMLHRLLDPQGFRWPLVHRAVEALLEGLRSERSG